MKEGNLGQYLKNSEERLLKAVWKRRKKIAVEKPEDYKKRKKDERWQELVEKPLPSQYHRQTKEVADGETWKWLKVGDTKRELNRRTYICSPCRIKR
jgi:hypothetical protein